MKNLILLVCIALSSSCYAQKSTFTADSITRRNMIEQLIANKSKAEFPELYGQLNDSTKVIRLINGGIVIKNKDTATFDLDLMKHLRINTKDDYLFYNIEPNGHHKMIGGYAAYDTHLGIQLYPPFSFRESYLDEIAKYYDLDNVVIMGLYGIGSCIMVDKEIWIIEGNERTDLKTHVKETFRTLAELRNLFLLEDSEFPFGR